jgi:hypothetical protein
MVVGRVDRRRRKVEGERPVAGRKGMVERTQRDVIARVVLAHVVTRELEAMDVSL